MENLTPGRFLSNFRHITLNTKYATRAKKLAEIFKNDFRPIENTLYWLEFLLKHKEDYYFKPSPSEVPFHEYLFLDFICIGLVFLMIVKKIVLMIFYYLRKIGGFFIRIFLKIFSRIFRRKVVIEKAKSKEKDGEESDGIEVLEEPEGTEELARSEVKKNQTDDEKKTQRKSKKLIKTD
jgi:hypothetical protein